MPAADAYETFLTLVLEHVDDELALAHRELYPERIPERIPLSLHARASSRCCPCAARSARRH